MNLPPIPAVCNLFQSQLPGRNPPQSGFFNLRPGDSPSLIKNRPIRPSRRTLLKYSSRGLKICLCFCDASVK